MKTQVSMAAGEYILDLYERMNRIAVLILNRDFRETVQRITSADKAASPGFQAWLRHKNASGSDIYIGMNPLKQEAATRTKDEIESIRHVYIDLDFGGIKALEGLRKSSLVPKPNYVLTSSTDKFQVVWKVEGIKLDEAETLLRALAREFGGDPAATDATRVLRLPGFANKKYGADFYVEAHRDSAEIYHFQDFKLHADAQDSPRHHHDQTRVKREAGNPRLTQSEHDWAFAKRALSRGDEPELVIRQIAEHRTGEKSNPQYYARLTVGKALAELGMDSANTADSLQPPAKEDPVERS
jgi:DNA primase RepB-like protein